VQNRVEIILAQLGPRSNFSDLGKIVFLTDQVMKDLSQVVLPKRAFVLFAFPLLVVGDLFLELD